MSGFKPYPAYKDSGVEWLGEVPEGWELKRLGHYFEERRERASDTEFEPLSVTKHGVVPRLESAAKTQDGDNRKKVLAGDFVINSRSDRKGSSGLSPLDGSVSLICTVLIPTRLHGPFIHHLFRSEPFQEEYYRWGKGIVADLWSTNFSDMKNIVLSVPSEAEQTQIARFLDYETARIDALIEEQQRLIELLKEKRQAVISHAVTKGLDPTVPMKDSGVEWLGEVPKHWAVRKLKNLVSVRGGSTPSKEVERYWEGDIPWVSPKDMKSERIKDSIDHVSGSAIEDGGLNMVKSGAVLIVVRGMILIHSVPVAITDVDVTINQDIKAMTPSAEISSDYLSLMLQGVKDAVFQYIDSSAHGTRKLEWERFELIDLPVPVRTEQIKVVSFIDKQKRAIDELAEHAASAITLMKERRSALISAAVTGKIDVRNWQPSEQAQEIDYEPMLQVAEPAASYE